MIDGADFDFEAEEYAIAMPKGDEALVSAVNQALKDIKEDGTFINLNPISNTAREAAAAENGCWKFKHDAGGPDNPNTYATFVYDLAQFNGSNVVLAIGVFNGEKSSNENKLVFHSVELN